MGPSGDFTIGGVIRQTFGIIRSGLPGLILIALVFVAVPKWLGPKLVAPSLAALRDPAVGRREGPVLVVLDAFGLSTASGLPAIVGSLVLTGAVTWAAMEGFAGRRAGFGGSLRASLTRLPATLAIKVLAYLGIALGLVLLVVPGLILSYMWVVAVPVHVAERGSILDALRRSRSLTAGHRWRIVGLTLIFGLTAGLVNGFMTGFTKVLIGRGVDPGVAAALQVAAAVLSSLVSLVGSAGLAAIYIALRRAKEGALPSDLVEAFA